MSGNGLKANGTRSNGTKVNGMPKALRWTLYGVGGGLWLSGCVWLLLHLFFETATAFGAEPHPWEPPLLLVHGMLAVPALYLLGWITSRHALDGWRVARRRMSGGIISIVLVILALSGFGLFFATGDAVRAAVALLHEVIGVACLVPALAHGQARSAPAPETVPETGTTVLK